MKCQVPLMHVCELSSSSPLPLSSSCGQLAQPTQTYMVTLYFDSPSVDTHKIHLQVISSYSVACQQCINRHSTLNLVKPLNL